MVGDPEGALVELRGITKRFPGGTLANDAIDLDLRRGEILALLGENGAGKSTLMGILYGLLRPDAGEIRLRGEPVRFRSPRDAIRHGLGMVHQHFMLVPTFTVAENFVLGRPSPRWPLLEDRRAVAARIAGLARRHGLAVDPDARVDRLSVGQQQRVEILKALYRGAEILILDEPTAVLTPQEADELLAILRGLAAAGRSVVFISHKLDEVLRVADRVAVLRDGRLVATLPAGVHLGSRARAADGRARGAAVGGGPLGRARRAPARARGRRGGGRPRGGGAARRRPPGPRRGDRRRRRGRRQRPARARGGGGRAASRPRGPRRCWPDATRRPRPCASASTPGSATSRPTATGRALLHDASLADNLVLERVGRSPFSRAGLLDRAAIARNARRLVEAFGVRPAAVDSPAGRLSGGNAQKLVLARALSRDPSVLLVCQPTRGVDLGAVERLHAEILRRRDDGAAILLISTELSEVMALADRILVLYEGRIAGERAGAATTAEELGPLMGGRRAEPARAA